MAKGVDSLAVKYAEENKIRVSEFPAQWKKHGNASGFRRNVEMARCADACVCFWNGKSPETKLNDRYCKKNESPTSVNQLLSHENRQHSQNFNCNQNEKQFKLLPGEVR
jgi:hypothetical protein